MATVISGELLATLKAGELLARQIVDRNPELFADVIAARRDARQPAPPPPGTGLTEAVIRGRLALAARTECADCGCEEFCIDYLRDLLAEIAPPSPGARADATNTEAAA